MAMDVNETSYITAHVCIHPLVLAYWKVPGQAGEYSNGEGLVNMSQYAVAPVRRCAPVDHLAKAGYRKHFLFGPVSPSERCARV